MKSALKKTAGKNHSQPAATPVVQSAPPVTSISHLQIQTTTKVSSPADPAEKEANSTAKKIMRMTAPASTVIAVPPSRSTLSRSLPKQKEEQQNKPELVSPYIARFASIPVISRQKDPEKELQRQAEEEEKPIQRKENADLEKEQPIQRQLDEKEQPLQRKAEGIPNISANISADIRNSMSGGQPLPLSVRRFMEPRFQANFSGIKIHTDDNAEKLNRGVNAKAFAVGSHIFFGRNQYQPETDQGRELIAHELTHTLQQNAAIQRQESPKVTERTPERVNRLGISDALNYFADRAHNIPGFRMFTIILGINPINMNRVDRNAANILRAVIEFLPGGGLITQALDNHGIFERISSWVAQRFNSIAMTGAAIRQALNRFLDSLGWRDIFNLSSVWQRAKQIFIAPINRLITFGRSLYRGIIQFIKEAILQPLARLISRTRGYDLLKAVLGRDPITGDPVPRTPATLIGGFMRLIGQEEIWNNLQQANAVPRAWAWFQGALAGLTGFVRQIPGMFLTTFRTLTITDIVLVPRAIIRVASIFAGFAGRFFRWAGAQVMQLLQIIFEVVAPGAMPFLRRARGAFRTIIQQPARFVRNLVRAGKMGLRNFATNFLTHLRTSLINWLTGTMSGTGVYIPQAFSLREILKFILSVLGLTWQNIRTKLVRAIGETAVRAMETGFELIRTLVTEGPAAAWRKILEGLQNLREMVIEQIMSFVQSRIIQAAITRLVSMLSPAGAFIQAIIATYNTIMFFVERMRTIMQVAMSFVNSIAAIAAGNLGAAARRVENTMAGMLTLVISFLARIAGLGRVADAVTRIINRVRRPIDNALNRIVAWIVRQARRAGRFIAQAGVPQDPQARLQLASRAAIAAAQRLRGRVTAQLLAPVLAIIRTRYGLTSITPFERSGSWWVRTVINPGREDSLGVSSADNSAGQASDTALPDQVEILDSSNAVMIHNYSRSARTGRFSSRLFSGTVTLNKLKHAPQTDQQDEPIITVSSPTSVEYTISSANATYGTPNSFQAVDRSDPDEAARYSQTRQAFPEVMRQWWRDEHNSSRLTQLHSAGLIDINPNGLVRGRSKWHYIYTQLNTAEKARLNGPVNKENMAELLSNLPANRRDSLGEAWKQRWSMSTHIHHIKPVNFGGSNENFIPLKAGIHIGSNGVHTKFWTPLKAFLMRLR